MYRAAVIALVVILAGLQYRLWLGDGGYTVVHQLQYQVDTLQNRNNDNKSRNQAMAAQIADLKGGKAAIAGRARADLGMIRDGEQFYLVPGSD